MKIIDLKHISPAIFFQAFPVHLIARHELPDELPEPCRMVFLLYMAELMYNHIL